MNIARVRVNGESSMAFLDNGTEINTIMPEYIEKPFARCHTYLRPCGWMSHLHGSGKCPHMTNWLCQVDGVQGYDEDQIALVIPDLCNFTAWVPVILGTPTIGCIMNV